MLAFNFVWKASYFYFRLENTKYGLIEVHKKTLQ